VKRALALLLMVALALLAVPAHATGYTACTPLDAGYTGRNDNIRRAAWLLNQTRIGYGETFSFNDTVGPRTEALGYCAAPNGRGADVVGGGVGQVASTLYLALLGIEGGVSFTELTTYGERYAGNYVADGGQAVVVAYDSDVDFCFTNYAADEMIIEMWQSGGQLYCSVSLSEALVSDRIPAMPISRQVASAAIDSGDDEAVLHNVALAADSIADTTLLPGDSFSFNAVVGPRGAEYGYVPAVNGRGAEVTGGGVAQVASAVWLSVKNLPDVSIVAKSTYGTRFNQSYVDSSADAILTDYNSGTDFVFRYTGSGSLTIYTWLDGSVLNCAVYQSP